MNEIEALKRDIFLKRQAIHLLIQEIEDLRAKNLELEKRLIPANQRSEEVNQ